MTCPFSDFVAVHATEVAHAMVPTGNGSNGHGPAESVPSAGQVIDAVLLAGETDDLRPLIELFDLAPGAEGIGSRLDAALRRLDVVRLQTLGVAAAEELGAHERRALAESTANELSRLARLLAAAVAGSLSDQLAVAATTGSSSMSITMHELRRPLTVISSYGQLLSAGMLGALPVTAMAAIDGITTSTETMVGMVDSLAEVSRLDDPEDDLRLETVSMDEIVTGAVDQVSQEAQLRNTSIRTDADGAVTLTGDRRRLTLALTNMVSNAVKHGPAGSVVLVRAFADDAGAHFTVHDQGDGFPAGDSRRLFDKYFRSGAERRSKVTGSGLGLFIVKAVAERHHGTVSARCAPAEGADFEMIIPIHQ